MTIGFFSVPRMKRTDRRKGTRSMQDGESDRREDEQMALWCETFKPDGDGSKQ